LDSRGSIPGRDKNFFATIASTPALVPPGFHPGGTEVLSPGVKRPDREADCSHLTSTEVKNTYTHTLYAFMVRGCTQKFPD